MGWQDAPVIEDKKQPAWASAPAVDQQEPKKVKDVPMWSSHGEGARRAELTKKLDEEQASGVQFARKGLRYVGAGTGAGLGALAGAPTAPLTAGSSSVGLGVAGGGLGYGIGDTIGNLAGGEDPARQLREMGSLFPPEEVQSNAAKSLYKGVTQNGLRSAENLVAMPYEIPRSIAMPAIAGDMGATKDAAKHAVTGLVEFPYIASGAKDVVEKYVTNEQPRDGVARNLQGMMEEDPFGVALGVKMGYHAPGAAASLAKKGAMKTLGTVTSVGAAENLYKSAMKPTKTASKQESVREAIQHGLDKGAVINRGGKGVKEAIHRVIQAEDNLAGVLEDSNGRVSVTNIDKQLDTVRRNADNNIMVKDAVLKSIDKYIETLKTHSQYDPTTGTLPVKEANKVKREMYKMLRKNGDFAEGKALAGEGIAAKGIANQLKTSIEKVAPEVGPLNQIMSKDLNLVEHLKAATARVGSTDMLPMRVRLSLLLGAMSPKYIGAAIAASLWDNPAFKSRLAIAIHKAHGGKMTPTEVRRIVREIPERLKQEAMEEAAQFNPEVLPPVTGNLGEVIPQSTRPAGLEEGGRRFENPYPIQRKQTIENPEYA